MNQVVSPEEMAALFEGLREADEGQLPYTATHPGRSGQETGFSLMPAA